jgi:hypothetical protein
MERAWFAAVAVAISFGVGIAAAGAPQEATAIDYVKSNGLVAAAYRGGQVVVWEFESGRVKAVFNGPGFGTSLNKRTAHFNSDGHILAYTAEGEAGLVATDLNRGTSTTLVPHRLLYRGIAAFSWSHQEDNVLVAIGRDIALISATGHTEWQRRLETRSLITDIAWHPSEKFYTVTTDDTVVSSYETISGQLIASEKMEAVAQPTGVRVGWFKDGSALVANVYKNGLIVLDPETLKPKKTIACGCVDFDWNPARREIAASAPPKIAVFPELASKGRDIQTPFECAGPVVWADESYILAAGPDSSVVLRDARSPKVLRTFMPPK